MRFKERFKNINNKAFSIWSVMLCVLIINFSIIATNSILSVLLAHTKILHNNTKHLHAATTLENCHAIYKNQLFCQQSSY